MEEVVGSPVSTDIRTVTSPTVPGFGMGVGEWLGKVLVDATTVTTRSGSLIFVVPAGGTQDTEGKGRGGDPGLHRSE